MQLFMFAVQWMGLSIILQNVSNVFAASPCPKGSWIHKNRCYVLVTEPMHSWTDANNYCSSLGTDQHPMQLVTIHDNATNNFLVKKLSASRLSAAAVAFVWIGLHDIAVDNEWRWVDGNRLADDEYTNWRTDIGRGNCADLITTSENRGKWSHEVCTLPAPFICSDTDTTPMCPKGGTFFRDRCYWIGTKGTLPMQEADKACQEEFGTDVRLPVIRDVEMNNFILRLMPSTWIGINDIETEGTMAWIDGNPVTYTNWYYNEPNNRDGEDCVVTRTDGRWNDVHCGSYHRYMCAVPSCYEDPNAAGTENNNCPNPCTSCVSDSVCFHNGECKCVAEFDGMVCNKGNFNMSISGKGTTLFIGDSIDLLCNINIPLRDVQLEWIKMDSNGTRSTLFGYYPPGRATYQLSIVNADIEDEALYYCIGVYTIGGFSQIQMTHQYLTVKSGDPTPALQISTASKTALSLTLAIFTIACVLLLVGLVAIIIQQRHRLNPSHDHVTLSSLVE